MALVTPDNFTEKDFKNYFFSKLFGLRLNCSTWFINGTMWFKYLEQRYTGKVKGKNNVPLACLPNISL